jgi:hypothetical protein
MPAEVRPGLSDQDIARVAAEGAIGPADLAPLRGGDAESRLRSWLQSTLHTYDEMTDAYTELPPQAQGQARVYAKLERKVAAVRQVIEANPWLTGSMVVREVNRLRVRAVVDDDRTGRIGMAATRRVRRDLRGLHLLEKRARSARLDIGERTRGKPTMPARGRAKRAVDDLTWAIFSFWHRVLKRPLLNEQGGVAIGSDTAPSHLLRFACAVYRLADGEDWIDPTLSFEGARRRLKGSLARSVIETLTSRTGEAA